MKNQFDEKMSLMTDEQLKDVLDKKDDYQAEAVIAAKNEIKLREKISNQISSGNFIGISDTELLNYANKKDVLPYSIIASLTEEAKRRNLIEENNDQNNDQTGTNEEYSDNSTISSFLNILGVILYILGIIGAIYLFVNLSKSGWSGKFDEDKLPQALIISALFLIYNVMFGLICQGISKLLNK